MRVFMYPARCAEKEHCGHVRPGKALPSRRSLTKMRLLDDRRPIDPFVLEPDVAASPLYARP
jgi:hypothetical protein